jgi:hypothetical protein
MSLLERLFDPGSAAGNYIGIFGLVASLIVVQVRSWRLERKQDKKGHA